MRILSLADSHIGAGYEHRRDALADTAAVLDQVVDLAVERGVTLVLHGGDVFHRTKPSPAELHTFKRFVDRLDEERIQLAVIHGNGNHEAAFGDRSAVELFASANVRVSRRPEVLGYPGVAICTLPAVPLGQLVAAGTTDRAQIHEQAAELLLQAARDLYVEEGRPRILLGHWAVSGASLPTGLPVDQLGEVVLPLAELEEIGYDAMVFGHIHRAQPLLSLFSPRPTVAFYCGSPQTQDFGEQADEHGCWIIDTEAKTDFVRLNDRRFVTVDVDLEGMLTHGDAVFFDWTDEIASAIAEHIPITDAVVRVRYRATEEQHRRVDQPALLRLLEDAGVHRVYGGIQWEPVRQTRARIEGVDESLSPKAALELWLTANEVADREPLKGLLDRYLVEETA